MVNTKATQPVNIPRLSAITDPESRVFRANFYPFSQDNDQVVMHFSIITLKIMRFFEFSKVMLLLVTIS